MKKYNRTLVVDSSFMPRSVISASRAFIINYKGNAEIIDEHPESFGLVNKDIDIKKPSIIRIFSYVKQEYLKIPPTRENIYKRDNHECVYCGSTRNLTLDHVVPQSKGGKGGWYNLVTACKLCNGEKADLTLEEYGKQIPELKRPHFLMLMKGMEEIPETWKNFLLF